MSTQGLIHGFLKHIQLIVETEKDIQSSPLAELTKERCYQFKRYGFSDAYMAHLWGTTEEAVRQKRWDLGVHPAFKRVDTCAAEFPTSTAYLYSSYEEFCEAKPHDARKVMVLGGGPNRIGQGIEFDYCCVHAALALREAGLETIMVNCNPETVSTDYDTSDRLYFESLTLEDVLEIIHLEKPEGVIVQYGGQTPLKLAKALHKAGVPLIGTSPDAIDAAEDRERFLKLIQDLRLKQPPSGIARTQEEGIAVAAKVGYPLMVRPSYVLGGRAMEIVHHESELKAYLRDAVEVSEDAPVLIDRFLDDAIEIDVDAICDGTDVFIGGILEHIEQAGVHSGDSACVLPPFSLSLECQEKIKEQMRQMAKALGVIGLVNAQFAVKEGEIYVIEVNPRASRTVPFVSKAIGLPLAKIAARVMIGQTLREQGVVKEIHPPHTSVKHSVFPFERFPGVDPILGPEMRSTGEVMGIGQNFGEAFAKSYFAAGCTIQEKGRVFISVKDSDKPATISIAKSLLDKGFELVATRGTYQALTAQGVTCTPVNKVQEGRPHVVDMIKNNQINFIINTTEGRQAIADSYTIRRSAVQQKVTYTTTLAAARAIVMALQYEKDKSVSCLQGLHQAIGEAS